MAGHPIDDVKGSFGTVTSPTPHSPSQKGKGAYENYEPRALMSQEYESSVRAFGILNSGMSVPFGSAGGSAQKIFLSQFGLPEI